MGRIKAKRSKPRQRSPKLSEMFLVSSAEIGLSTEGRRRREVLERTGRCPCGAVAKVPPGMRRGTQVTIPVQHIYPCPAVVQDDLTPGFVEWLHENTRKQGDS